MEIIIASLIAGIATVLAAALKGVFSDQKKPCKLVKHTIQNEDVYKALEYILDSLSADRVVVYEFHNGDIYYSGSSQQKFSNTYEVLSEGVSSELKNQQNLRVSSFNRFIKPLIDNDEYSFGEISNIDNVAIKEFFEDQGTKSTFCVPIKLLTGKIIGILGVDFVKGTKVLDDKEKKFSKNQETIIAGYLKS